MPKRAKLLEIEICLLSNTVPQATLVFLTNSGNKERTLKESKG